MSWGQVFLARTRCFRRVELPVTFINDGWLCHSSATPSCRLPLWNLPQFLLLSRRGSQALLFNTWWEHYFFVVVESFILSLLPLSCFPPSAYHLNLPTIPLSSILNPKAMTAHVFINSTFYLLDFRFFFPMPVFFPLSSWVRWWMNSPPSVSL